MTTISNQLSSLTAFNRDLQKDKAAKADSGKSAKSAVSAAASNVELTEKLNQLRASISAEAPVDAKRVQEIKAAIKEGHYAVDFEKLADAMIEMEFGIGKDK